MGQVGQHPDTIPPAENKLSMVPLGSVAPQA